MSLVKMMRRIEFINYLIKTKSTGNLQSLAKKALVSKRAMTDYSNQLREIGADIRYDRVRQTYYYGKEGEINSCKFIEYGSVLSRHETRLVTDAEELCFSEKAVFIPCKEIYPDEP